jgi:hypothetical protein
MRPKRKIPAYELASDIRMGLSNSELMEKYHLSVAGLASIFKKLVQARVIEKSEVQRRMEPGDDTADLDQMRKVPRCYPVVPIPVVDLSDMQQEGILRDLTEKGIQVEGIHAEAGQTKNLLVQADAFTGTLPFTLETCCKWIKPRNAGKRPLAGFEITSISEADLELLRGTIELFAFCDNTKRS